jgi:hypothetical protein
MRSEGAPSRSAGSLRVYIHLVIPGHTAANLRNLLPVAAAHSGPIQGSQWVHGSQWSRWSRWRRCSQGSQGVQGVQGNKGNHRITSNENHAAENNKNHQDAEITTESTPLDTATRACHRHVQGHARRLPVAAAPRHAHRNVRAALHGLPESRTAARSRWSKSPGGLRPPDDRSRNTTSATPRLGE